MADGLNDDRFTVPLYTLTDAAQFLRVPRQTLSRWVDEKDVLPPLVTTLSGPTWRGEQRIPFIGIAEAYVLNAFRRAGVPLQRIRPSLAALTDELGPHALASNRLYTDGAEVLWNLGPDVAEIAALKLIVPRSNQYVFNEVVASYLRRMAFSDGYARLIRLDTYGDADVVLDPARGYGRPVFDKVGVTVENVFGALRAGDSIEDTAADFGLSAAELRNAWALSAWRPVLPHAFVDRSLGATQVPRLLRSAGLELTTMREHYGEEVAQRVDDVDWLIEISSLGWIGFCKDGQIRRNEAERRTVIAHRARLFVVSNANVSAAQAAARYLDNLEAIETAARQPGPFIFGLRPDRIEQLL